MHYHYWDYNSSLKGIRKINKQWKFIVLHMYIYICLNNTETITPV